MESKPIIIPREDGISLLKFVLRHAKKPSFSRTGDSLENKTGNEGWNEARKSERENDLPFDYSNQHSSWSAD